MGSIESTKKALVVSPSEYKLLEPLFFCKNDGEKMSEVLKSLNYNMENKKLIGKVGSVDLREALREFFRGREVKPDDTLVFYYSGHGVVDGFGDHYLAPYEIDPFEPDKEGIL